ncbi:unnamed protein product [Gongylonema pulchrum]|uniref:Ion_trans_2 domain-containing protein n=1 Tax=Gongylonema pulchrum TaxID=637853 RepID=A0A3P7PDJ0_9BILA|nr:unnamed protein product [Gongylonema pulchrum]
MLMLIYLGVGLAVTTMCIDLVGIQYIQKIHYFGRKFRGTDIFQLLRRKRMIERRLAMGQGDELLQLYLRQLQQARSGFVCSSGRFAISKLLFKILKIMNSGTTSLLR